MITTRLMQNLSFVYSPSKCSNVGFTPTWQEFAETSLYKSILLDRVESARPGLNVTSLYAHSDIAGKFSRVVGQYELTGVTATSDWERVVKPARQRARLTVAHLRVVFPQKPFRARDLNVFAERRTKVEQISSRYPDNVLTMIGNEVVLVSVTSETADRLAGEFLEAGFHIQQRRVTRSLEEVTKRGVQEVLSVPWLYTYPDLALEIVPPLCESCQMARGMKRWPADLLMEREHLSDATKSMLRNTPWQALRVEDLPSQDQNQVAGWLEGYAEEELCERCFNLRRDAPSRTRLGEWSSGEVAWVHIALDLDELVAALAHLHKAYLRSAVPNIPTEVVQKLQVRFPLVVDFLADYKVFLSDFGDGLVRSVGEENVQPVDEGLWAVRLARRSQAMDMLDRYYTGLKRRFPKFLESSAPDCPIRLGLSISNVKHPFFSHWRFLERPSDAISVQIVSSGTASVRAQNLGDILGLLNVPDNRKRRAFHRLREIAETSRSLAELVLNDIGDRNSHEYQKLREILPMKLDYESMMTLINLAEEQTHGEVNRSRG